MTAVDLGLPTRLVELTLDGETAQVPEGSTILAACAAAGRQIPTLCYGDTLTPRNACRVCVVDAERDAPHAGHHEVPDGQSAETVHQPAKVDNDLYVRDYGKCILCYKCVDACGDQWQNTFAITVAGR